MTARETNPTVRWCPNRWATWDSGSRRRGSPGGNARMSQQQATGDATPVRRPNPLWWFWYALGGRLPARYSSWVLHDTTTRTWVLRHMARAFVQMMVPIGLVLLLLPGEFWIRGMAALGGLLLGMFYSVA